MRNTWLILKREYLERVKKKSFLVLTILVPALMAGAIWIPMQIATHGTNEKRHVAVIAPTAELADSVKQQLTMPVNDEDPFAADSNQEKGKKKPSVYTVDVGTDLSSANQDRLTSEVNDGRLNGFLWITPEAIQKRKFEYYSKDSANFEEQESLRSALRLAITERNLAGKGLSANEIDSLLKPISMDAKRIQKGKASKSNGVALFTASLIMVTLLYLTVLVYGMMVMRSVIEEKGSRIMEVMLSSVTPRDMMAGKILGVGAVGLTQIIIWIVFSVLLSGPLMMALRSMNTEMPIAISSIVYFGVFFLLGYLLYSALYAAIGAMVNSEQEAQQVQFVVLAPLIFAMIIAGQVVSHPNSPLAVWTSMIPFCAPMLMFVRILIETPPWWQIALCLALLVGTIWVLLLLCARIYRVGVLMYGKRPTLPELLKWVKYSG